MNEAIKFAHLYRVLRSCRTLDQLMTFSAWVERLKVKDFNIFSIRAETIRQGAAIDRMQKLLTEQQTDANIQSDQE